MPEVTLTMDIAVVDDAEALLAYSREVGAQTEYLSFDAAGLPLTVEQEQFFLQTMEASVNQLMLVVKDAQRIVAVGSIGPIGTHEKFSHVGELGISVTQDYWGQGVASWLMDELIHWATHQSPLEKLTLEVVASNIVAIHLYNRYGFVQEGCLKRAVRLSTGYEDVWTMSKWIGGTTA